MEARRGKEMKRTLKIIGLFLFALLNRHKLKPDYTIGDFKKDIKDILG
jgi:hypothetical protein